MADNFTVNQVQGVFGKFVPVLDEAVSGGDFSADNVQGVFGEFVPVLDEAAGPVPGGANLPPYGQVIFNSADEENRPRYGQRIARGTEE